MFTKREEKTHQSELYQRPVMPRRLFQYLTMVVAAVGAQWLCTVTPLIVFPEKSLIITISRCVAPVTYLFTPVAVVAAVVARERARARETLSAFTLLRIPA